MLAAVAVAVVVVRTRAQAQGWRGSGALGSLPLCSLRAPGPQTNQEGVYGVRTFHLTNGGAVVTQRPVCLWTQEKLRLPPSLEQGALGRGQSSTDAPFCPAGLPAGAAEAPRHLQALRHRHLTHGLPAAVRDQRCHVLRTDYL